MTEQNFTNADRLYGSDVYDNAGEKIGEIAQVYLDDQTGQPTWATVKTGLFGMKETFIPLDNTSTTGDQLRVPFTKDHVKGAPSIDADHHLSAEEEADLYRYYSRDYDTVTTGDVRDGAAYTDTNRVADRDVEVDRDRADGSVVRHEEELHVGKERVATGQMRLRKHVVTEQKTVTVPVSHEEYTLERQPMRDGEVGDGRLGEDEISVTQYEERPVIEKEVVAKERVGLHKETVTEQRQVSADVSREEVTLEQDGTARDGLRDDLRDGDRRL